MTFNTKWIFSAFLLSLLGGCIMVTPPPGPNRSKVEAPGKQDSAGKILNDFRRANGLPPLSLNSQLTRAASNQSAEMQAMGALRHVSRDGKTLKPRIQAVGYPVCYGAENIGNGWPTTSIIFQKWIESPLHRKNMLNPKVTEYGYASSPGKWHTLILASRC